MKRVFLAVIVAVTVSALMFGCSGGNAQQSEKQEASTTTAESQDDGKLTDDEKNQISAYLQSDEFANMSNAINDFSDRFIDAAEAKDVDTIDEIFMELSNAINDMDNLEVPSICKEADYNFRQAARCYAVTAGDFSSYLHGDYDDSKLDEANEYLEMGNQFINDMTEEMNRLSDLAQ